MINILSISTIGVTQIARRPDNIEQLRIFLGLITELLLSKDIFMSSVDLMELIISTPSEEWMYQLLIGYRYYFLCNTLTINCCRKTRWSAGCFFHVIINWEHTVLKDDEEFSFDRHFGKKSSLLSNNMLFSEFRFSDVVCRQPEKPESK